MATVEELLETLISIEEENQTIESTQDSTINSEIEEIKTQINILSSGQVDETTPNYILNGLQLINASQGAYTSDQVLENNSAYYSDIKSIKEMFQYQFIIFGVIIAFFIVILIIKGFFKNVSN